MSVKHLAWGLACRKHSFTCLHVCSDPSTRYLSETVNTFIDGTLTNIVFYPEVGMHSSFTVPLIALERCPEVKALLSLLLWKGNRMEIMISLEPELRRASVPTLLATRHSQCCLWRQRTSKIKATAKVSSHTPRAPCMEGILCNRKNTFSTALLYSMCQGEPLPGWVFKKHRFEWQRNLKTAPCI